MPHSNAFEKVNRTYLKPGAAEKIKKDYLSYTRETDAVLERFLDDEFLKLVSDELEEEKWHSKNNDLYTFFQSNGLEQIERPNVQAAKNILYSREFRKLLQAVLGIRLSSKVDASASRYWSHCHLLCHDDEYQGRRVAFILYLVPEDWSPEDGGMLDLFEVDENGQPTKIIESILPRWNQFVFFEVTPFSFHQVSEVLSTSKQRLAISGWFYGESVYSPTEYEEPPLPRRPLLRFDESPNEYLKDWINPSYLLPASRASIRKRFGKYSHVQLQRFLVRSKHLKLRKAFSPSNQAAPNWTTIGPANRRHYESLGRWEQSEAPKIIDEAIRMFQSPQFACLLQKLTRLALSHMHLEVRQFRHRSYTLVQDNTQQHNETGLDVYYCLCEEDCWDIDVGGQITYIDEDHELITFVPLDNSICMAFRDEGCMKFLTVSHAVRASDTETGDRYVGDARDFDAGEAGLSVREDRPRTARVCERY
ncbi:prolyl 3-hydroxylase OGFOD1-like [Schistocerca gregaria]|uniref:prolyl 3-hydroxylase OGFOD1-like n=1 Tax=Schistocerca gregaria TaxID=7010 RepID=UPI00211F41A2|nr:prolyl 3-hydroxylase OGFOD1-like [Schistocerca gregaria]